MEKSIKKEKETKKTDFDTGFVAFGAGYSQPCGQFEQIHENIFVQLNVGHLAFSLECAYVYLIGRHILQIFRYLLDQRVFD